MNQTEISTLKQSPLVERLEALGSFIGNTPLFPITGFHRHKGVKIYAKLEWLQLGDSVKARPAYRIVKDAAENGLLTEAKHLLDASSGNTGIAYAHLGAALGIPVTLCLPENASTERKRTLRALGVDIRYTSPTGTTDEAQEMALRLANENPDRFYYADQYNNESNWRAHFDTTGPEILDQTGNSVTHFVSALGTTGTFTGTARKLKEYNPDIQCIALQPDIAMHGLEGWKHLETAAIPGIYDPGLADTLLEISTEAAYQLIKKTAAGEGLLLSPSAAANLAGALRVSEQVEKGVVVTIFPDDGSRYGEVMNQLFNESL